MTINLHRVFVILISLFFNFKLFAVSDTTDFIIINDDFKELELQNQVRVYTSERNYNITDFRKVKNKLHCLDKGDYFPGFADNFYWMVFDIKNIGKKKRNIILEINNPQIDTLRLYKIESDSSIKLIDLNGDEIPFIFRNTPFEVPAFLLEINPGEAPKYILKLSKRKSIKFPAKLYDYKTYMKHSRLKLLFYGLYFGGVFITFLIAFVIGFFIKNKTLIAYSLYAISIGWFIFADSGYSYEFIYPTVTGYHSWIRVFNSMIVLILFIVFSNLFIETKKTFPVLIKVFNVIYVLWFCLYIIPHILWQIKPSIYRILSK